MPVTDSGWTGAWLVGRAVTVRLHLDEGRPRSIHLGTRALEAAQQGDVIVVDHRGRLRPAGWGGLLSLAAKVRGVAGVIVDGAVRDVDDARSVGPPLLARRATPLTARGRVVEGAFNVPVEVGGVVVAPGDLVVADGSGVVVVPWDRVGAVLEAAEAIAAHERRGWEAIAAGTPPTAVLGRRYEDLRRDADRGRG
jgi:4-hydroxy-4-methyl-2-oxoglutarate aldolase